MLTSNLVLSQWDQIFRDQMATAAAIDRLVHHSVVLEFDVPSYRTDPARPARSSHTARTAPPASGSAVAAPPPRHNFLSTRSHRRRRAVARLLRSASALRATAAANRARSPGGPAGTLALVQPIDANNDPRAPLSLRTATSTCAPSEISSEPAKIVVQKRPQ